MVDNNAVLFEDNITYPRRIEILSLTIDYVKWILSLPFEDKAKVIKYHISRHETDNKTHSNLRFTMSMFDQTIIYAESIVDDSILHSLWVRNYNSYNKALEEVHDNLLVKVIEIIKTKILDAC